MMSPHRQVFKMPNLAMFGHVRVLSHKFLDLLSAKKLSIFIVNKIIFTQIKRMVTISA